MSKNIVFAFATMVFCFCAIASAAALADEPLPAKLPGGMWRIDSYLRSGVPDGEMSGGKAEITDSTIVITSTGKEIAMRYSLGSAKPLPINCKQQWDELDKDFVLRFEGIIETDGDKIAFCFPTRSDGARPRTFESTKANGQSVMRLSRIK